MKPKHGLLSTALRLLPLSILAVAAADTATATGDRDRPDSQPLMIKEQGSFFVGGRVVNRGPNDDITLDQMYVQYQIPAGKTEVPIVFTHGCCLSSKTWETTPDGRMGWDEYFLRKGHPVYLTDQAGRARSGFDATRFNQVRAGTLPPNQQPSINQVSHQSAWSIFRFGPSFGVPHSDGQFPIAATGELYKQTIPDLVSGFGPFLPTWPDLAELGKKVGGAVLVGHSQSGLYPFHAYLLNPKSAKALINIEAGGTCHENFGQTETGAPSAEDMRQLAKIPILIIYGDHLQGTTWQGVFEDCQLLVNEINAIGGNATMVHLPEIGIRGNSHMMMQDKNSLKIADLILKWIDRNVDNKRGNGGRDDDDDDHDHDHGHGNDRDHDGGRGDGGRR